MQNLIDQFSSVCYLSCVSLDLIGAIYSYYQKTVVNAFVAVVPSLFSANFGRLGVYFVVGDAALTPCLEALSLEIILIMSCFS